MTSALLALMVEKVSHLGRNTVKEKIQPGDLQQSKRTTVEKLHAANADAPQMEEMGITDLNEQRRHASDPLDHFLLPCM